ncbi:MAG: radical SAM protein [Deltaproteobacteria bacterium]|nr:radical SAM protein [Deltaproteobacteria bacterium]
MATSLTSQAFSLWKSLRQGRVPGQLVIQITDQCNATCPQCGMRATASFPRNTLKTDDVKRILDKAVERGIKIVSFTGGEPFLQLETLVTLISHAGNIGIEHIRTGTNGFLFLNSDKPRFQQKVKIIAEKLATTKLRNLWISVDSADPSVHETMRGFPGVIRGIERALPVFHSFGIYPSANLGINRNIGGTSTSSISISTNSRDEEAAYFYESFRNAFRRFYKFIIDMGFTMVNSCYPMSLDDPQPESQLKAIYGATSQENVVKFSDAERVLLFRALFDIIPEYRTKIRIFSPRSSLYALCRQYEGFPSFPYPCRGGKDFFFIDSKDGNTYPCGYRGQENLGKFWDMIWPAASNGSGCRLCDWECFRDPSELFGPLLLGSSLPGSLIRALKNDLHRFRLWLEDVRYYRACDFFDGRRAPKLKQLHRFATVKFHEYDSSHWSIKDG